MRAASSPSPPPPPRSCPPRARARPARAPAAPGGAADAARPPGAARSSRRGDRRLAPLVQPSLAQLQRAVRARGETHVGEHREAARACLRAPYAVELEHQAHVLLDIEGRDEVEELVDEADVSAAEERTGGLAHRRHLTAVDLHGSAVGVVDAADEIEES